MICLFSSIKEIFTGQPLISFKRGACKARESVIIAPYTCLPDSNNYKGVRTGILCGFEFYRTAIIFHNIGISGQQAAKITEKYGRKNKIAYLGRGDSYLGPRRQLSWSEKIASLKMGVFCFEKGSLSVIQISHID